VSKINLSFKTQGHNRTLNLGLLRKKKGKPEVKNRIPTDKENPLARR